MGPGGLYPAPDLARCSELADLKVSSLHSCSTSSDGPAHVNPCEAGLAPGISVPLGVLLGSLIHAVVGMAGGTGGFRTKRSG